MSADVALVVDADRRETLAAIFWMQNQRMIGAELAARWMARIRAGIEHPGPGTPSEIPPFLDPGPGPYPPVPLERLRQLTEAERWHALVFLSGLAPRAVEQALAAVLTPLSTAGVAWR